MQALTVCVRGWICVGVLAAGAGTALGQPAPADPLTRARQFYNAGRYDEAITTAREAIARPGTQSEANLLLGRALLERHRASRTDEDLSGARDALRAVDSAHLNERGRIDLLVGLGEALYLDGQYRPAAALLEPVLEQTSQLSAAAREQVVDWWATATDRHAQTRPPDERADIYDGLSSRLRLHLGRYPDSAAASYWLPAAALARGDLALAWDLALAGWVRSTLAPAKGVALRADLDRLVLQALIPERVKRLTDEPDAGATARFTAEWEEAKQRWKL
jgi:tetratricopeptide (TPR) repeat protein